MQGYDFEDHQDSQDKMYIVIATSISRDKHSPLTMCFCKGVMLHSLLKILKVIVKAMIIKRPLIWPLDC